MAVTVGMARYCPKCGWYVLQGRCCNRDCDFVVKEE